MNNIWDMFGMDECEEKCCDMYLPSFLKSRSSSNSSNDLDIPCFLRKNKKVKSESKTLEVKKTNKEILEDDELQEELRIREKHRMDYNNNMIYAWEKGFREGFEESFKNSFIILFISSLLF